jgi:hypothetical protein
MNLHIRVVTSENAVTAKFAPALKVRIEPVR